jgi:hypothetical protein
MVFFRGLVSRQSGLLFDEARRSDMRALTTIAEVDAHVIDHVDSHDVVKFRPGSEAAEENMVGDDWQPLGHRRIILPR